MLLISFLILLSSIFVNSNNKIYKRLHLKPPGWTKFVSKSINHDIKTRIECGSTCNYHDSNCDLFIHLKDEDMCHIGTFENGNQNYLSSNDFSGQYPVYLSLGKYQISKTVYIFIKTFLKTTQSFI